MGKDTCLRRELTKEGLTSALFPTGPSWQGTLFRGSYSTLAGIYDGEGCPLVCETARRKQPIGRILTRNQDQNNLMDGCSPKPGGGVRIRNLNDLTMLTRVSLFQRVAHGRGGPHLSNMRNGKSSRRTTNKYRGTLRPLLRFSFIGHQSRGEMPQNMCYGVKEATSQIDGRAARRF